jgi:hypothetical protein
MLQCEREMKTVPERGPSADDGAIDSSVSIVSAAKRNKAIVSVALYVDQSSNRPDAADSRNRTICRSKRHACGNFI